MKNETQTTEYQTKTVLDVEDEPSDHSEAPTGEIAFDQIQGNCLGGFNKDHQAMIFLTVTDLNQARATLGGTDTDPTGIIADVAASSSEQVLRFNAQFKALRSQGLPEGLISATWTNLVVTYKGMKALGVPPAEADLFPSAFVEGMKNRASSLGDTGDSAPSHWDSIVSWDDVDITLIVASDDPLEVNGHNASGRVGGYLAAIKAPNSGLALAGDGVIYGATRSDQPGHEHFGFKDGVSQPGVRGVNTPDDPIANPDQGHPGQDLLQPGEFVLGYPRQKPTALDGHDGPNPEPGLISGSGEAYLPLNEAIDPDGTRPALPGWANNGSYLVFRRLEQDVHGFHDFVKKTASSVGMSRTLFGASLVGRYASGAPLELRTFQQGDADTYQPPQTDPGASQPALGNDDTVNNNFEYGDDVEGRIVPRGAHIRKAYPRDQVPTNEFGLPTPFDKEDSESRTQVHRLLRRGIPYGESTGHNKRGLLFLAYQTDIARQFEFVQKHWVNAENFPVDNAGKDPILSQRTDAAGNPSPMSMCPFAQKVPTTVQIHHFVTTRGGNYFFSPSIDTLTKWWNPNA